MFKSVDGEIVLLMILLGGLALFGLIVAGLVEQSRKDRREHELKARALELGRPMPGQSVDSTSMPVKLGVWVPVGVFGLAGFTAMMVPDVGPFVAVSAGVVGAASVICGTVLATIRPTPDSAGYAGGTIAQGKPSDHDADAFDVVGRRG